MLKINTRLIVMMFVLPAFIFIGFPVFAQENNSRIKVEIRCLDPDNLMVTLPVPIEVKVTNNTNEHTSLPVLDNDEYGITGIFYKKEGEKVYHKIKGIVPNFRPQKESEYDPWRDSLPMVDLNAKAAMVRIYYLTYDWSSGSLKKLLFPETGKYRIKVVFYGWIYDKKHKIYIKDNKVESASDEIELNISEIDSKNKQAFESLQQIPDNWLIYALIAYKQGGHAGASEKFSAFLIKYPDSIYAPYVQLLLAEMYITGVEYENWKRHEPNFAKAKEMLLLVLQNKTFIYRDLAQKMLNDIEKKEKL